VCSTGNVAIWNYCSFRPIKMYDHRTKHLISSVLCIIVKFNKIKLHGYPVTKNSMHRPTLNMWPYKYINFKEQCSLFCVHIGEFIFWYARLWLSQNLKHDEELTLQSRPRTSYGYTHAKCWLFVKSSCLCTLYCTNVQPLLQTLPCSTKMRWMANEVNLPKQML
jgi:hypothetical protein